MNMDDLDQNLLRQFSRLGTTDKYELMKQMMTLLADNHVSDSTAEFFLDMNDWNLQAAICSYFDFESHKLPCMMLICDDTIDKRESIPPNTKFETSWHVLNVGVEKWPDGICLQHTGGKQMGDCRRVQVLPLDPGTTTEINVMLTSPPDVGVHKSKWRMMTSTGSYFGDEIWVEIRVSVPVSECGTLAVTQQLSHSTIN